MHNGNGGRPANGGTGVGVGVGIGAEASASASGSSSGRSQVASSSSEPDALSLYSAALSTSDNAAQAKALDSLYASFQAQPANLPILFPSIVTLLGRAGLEGPLRGWIAKVLDLTFNRPTLNPNQRAALASHAPDAILWYLQEPTKAFVVPAIQCFASVYPHLFRVVCLDRSPAASQRLWGTLEAIKAEISRHYDAAGPSPAIGVKVAALKAFQRIVQVQTRITASTAPITSQQAYANASAKGADTNLAMVAPDHPVMSIAKLEGEANRHLTQVVTLIFTSSTPDLVMAAMNSLALLAKTRPTLNPIVLEALISWTPAALAGVSHTQIRNVEKTLRLLFFHFHPSRNSLASQHGPQVVEALDQQRIRMEKANLEEMDRAWSKRDTAAGKRRRGADGASGRKRVRFAGDEDEEPAAEAPQTSTPLGTPPRPSQPPTAPPPGPVIPALETPGPPPTGPQLPPSAVAAAFRGELPGAPAAPPNPMAAFDVKTLPVGLIVDLIIANLQARGVTELEAAIQRTRQNLEAMEAHVHGGGVAAEAAETKTEGEALDPLKVEVGDEELGISEEVQEGPADAVEMQDAGEQENALAGLEGFELSHPEPLSRKETEALIQDSISRMCFTGAKSEPSMALVKADAGGEDKQATAAVSAPAATTRSLWSTLVTRIVTRGFAAAGGDAAAPSESTELVKASARELAVQGDVVRGMLLNFVREDFANRLGFAAQWLAEEWSNEYLRRKRLGDAAASEPSRYDEWLAKLVDEVIPTLESKSKSLTTLLSDVPHVPDAVIERMEKLCVDKANMSQGFIVLRDIASYRPAARARASAVLLGLTRHEDKAIRSAAIITTKGWIGHSSALEVAVLEYAREGLDKVKTAELGVLDEAGKEEATENGEAADAAEDVKKDETTSDEEKETARWDLQTLRLVELILALSVKKLDLLDEVFAAYPSMPTPAQEAMKKHVAPLVRSLGPNNAKLAHVLRHFPQGADSLALAVFGLLTEKGRNAKLTAIVKALVEERDVDPRFLIPIMADLNKAEIMKHLPRVITILHSKAPASKTPSAKTTEDRQLIKSVFTSIVAAPPQGFGSVSTNLPRVRQTELLSPVELMVLLHHADKDMPSLSSSDAVRAAAEAIRICFGMPDVFTSEVLGAVLNQIVEEPELPILFMRTAIVAVATYKSLSSYVSTTLFPRLITRKIWQTPLLWDGFILCARNTAPTSYGALIQLPREQLRDVAARQPALREGLREHLTKKAGGNAARLQAFLELLGPAEAAPASPGRSSPTPSSDATPAPPAASTPAPAS